jgi:hypothetical protein
MEITLRVRSRSSVDSRSAPGTESMYDLCAEPYHMASPSSLKVSASYSLITATLPQFAVAAGSRRDPTPAPQVHDVKDKVAAPSKSHRTVEP